MKVSYLQLEQFPYITVELSTTLSSMGYFESIEERIKTDTLNECSVNRCESLVSQISICNEEIKYSTLVLKFHDFENYFGSICSNHLRAYEKCNQICRILESPPFPIDIIQCTSPPPSSFDYSSISCIEVDFPFASESFNKHCLCENCAF